MQLNITNKMKETYERILERTCTQCYIKETRPNYALIAFGVDVDIVYIFRNFDWLIDVTCSFSFSHTN